MRTQEEMWGLSPGRWSRPMWDLATHQTCRGQRPGCNLQPSRTLFVRLVRYTLYDWCDFDKKIDARIRPRGSALIYKFTVESSAHRLCKALSSARVSGAGRGVTTRRN